MTTTHARKELAETFLKRIQANAPSKTDPLIMEKIFSELKLHDFQPKDASFSQCLHKLVNEPVDVTLLVKKVISSLLENEPLCSIFSYIQDNELINDAEIEAAANELQLFINFLCLFEAFTFAMANTPTSTEDIYCYLTQQRFPYHSGNPYINFFSGMPFNATFFERIKTIPLDRSIASIALHKLTGDKEETIKDVKQFVKKHRLSGWNANITRAVCNHAGNFTPRFYAVNIFEASWQNSAQRYSSIGGTDNAIAEFGLIGIMEDKQYPGYIKCLPSILPIGVTLNDDDRYPLLTDLKISRTLKKIEIIEIDPEWKDLYISCNLFFIAANYRDILLSVKLLIPSVLSTTPGYFIENRALALFLIANLWLNCQVRKNSFLSPRINFRHADKIFSSWGKINKEYAESLLKTLCPHLSKNPTDLHRDVFGNHPTFNFFKKMLSFLINSKNFFLTRR